MRPGNDKLTRPHGFAVGPRHFTDGARSDGGPMGRESTSWAAVFTVILAFPSRTPYNDT